MATKRLAVILLVTSCTEAGLPLGPGESRDAGPTLDGAVAPEDAGANDAAWPPLPCELPPIHSEVVDTTPPELVSVTFDKERALLGDEVQIAVDVREEGCGLTYVSATVGRGDTVSSQEAPVALRQEEGLWVGTLRVDACFEPRLYVVKGVYLSDGAGHRANYRSEAGVPTFLRDLTQETAIVVPTLEVVAPDVRPAPLTGLALAETEDGFQVEISTGTVTACPLDDEVLISVSEEGESPISMAGVGQLVDGSASIDVSLPECLRQAGTWKLESVTLRSTLGNIYYQEDLNGYFVHRLGEPSVPAPPPIVRGGPVTDRFGPVVTNLTVTSSEHPAGTVAWVSADASDECGLGSGAFSFEHSASGLGLFGELHPTMNHVQGCLVIPRCAPRGVYRLSGFGVGDQAGRTSSRCLRDGTRYDECFDDASDPASEFPQRALYIEHW